MDIYSEFELFDSTYKERDGYDKTVMDIKTGKVYGMNDNNCDIYFISNQEYNSEIKYKGSLGIVKACILDFDGHVGLWEY